jgi:hypothetical protein
MLTILHKETHGSESVRQAKWAQYYSETNTLVTGMAVMDQPNPDGTEHDTFASGEVFVMNDNGKTVARYWLE